MRSYAARRKLQERRERLAAVDANSQPANGAADESIQDVQAKRQAELKAKQEAELKAKEEADLKAKQEAEWQAADLKAKEEVELKARQEAELKAKQEAEARAERLAKEAADKAEAERLAKEAADKAEAERLAKEAADKVEAERLAKEAAAKAEAERLAKQEVKQEAKQEVEAEIKANEQAVRLLKDVPANSEEGIDGSITNTAEQASMCSVTGTCSEPPRTPSPSLSQKVLPKLQKLHMELAELRKVRCTINSARTHVLIPFCVQEMARLSQAAIMLNARMQVDRKQSAQISTHRHINEHFLLSCVRL